ncbi:MAG: hypothetical protein IKV88_01680 [Clostridia bacterium]|nr:hypothetical protein [Clostridia bacterium]
MVRTEVTNNVCIVGISTDLKEASNLNQIKSSLTDEGIFPVFVSHSSLIGSADKLIVAIDSDDVFHLMNVLGKIRHSAKIKNYSINCSNSMIKWENRCNENLEFPANCSQDVKFIYMWEDKGVCFCETSSVNKICAELC